MYRYGTRHHVTRSAVIIAVVMSLVLAAFARPASAAAPLSTATLVAGATSDYPIVVIETAKASLTVGEIRRLAEQATHRSLPASPDKVWFADTGRTQPTRAQVDALIAGQQAPGVTVFRTVTQPAPQHTVGDLSAGLPGVQAIWAWLIWVVIFIIKIIIDNTD